MTNPIQSRRISYLDGVRGIGAATVMAYHFYAFTPGFLPSPTSPVTILNGSPLFALINGRLSVAIFFVLSGFVIALAAERSSEPFPLRVLKRYMRLAIPALVAVAISWGLVSLFPRTPAETIAAVGGDWMRGFEYVGPPPLSSVPRMGLFDPFVHAGSYLNGALWTMKPELLGSLAIYVVFQFVPRRFRV